MNIAVALMILGLGAASDDDEARIRDVPEQWRLAYNGGNSGAVAALYTEDAYYVSAHVVAHGRQEVEAYFRRGIAAGGHVDEIRILSTRRACDLAYALGTYQATNAGQVYRGRILVVLRKSAGRWLMEAHETVVADQP